jgi:hypothetical protein
MMLLKEAVICASPVDSTATFRFLAVFDDFDPAFAIFFRI